jgi:hypothetical protein
MKRISLVASVMAAAVVVLAVSSCAPAVHPSTAPTSHPHLTPKPHPSATQAATPSVRVPIKCSALFTDAAVSAIIDSPISVHRDGTTIPVTVTAITERQYGSLSCLWGGEAEDSGFVEDLAVDISPAAKAGFIQNLSGFSNENPPVVVNSVGDQSVYGCDSAGELSCAGNMLVGDYWVTANLVNIAESGISQSTANGRIQQALATVATALANAKAGPAWVPPGTPLPTFCSVDASTAKVNTALAVTDFAPVGDDEQETDAASYTQQTGTYTQCAWGTGATTEPFTYVSVAMLEGGAWVVPLLPGHKNPQAYMLDTYSAMTIPGATTAAGDCSEGADECEVALSIGSLLVVIDIDDPGNAQAMTAIANVVADIKAS